VECAKMFALNGQTNYATTSLKHLKEEKRKNKLGNQG